MRVLRINFELKTNLPQDQKPLVFHLLSKITLIAVLYTALACGGIELPFWMKTWAWVSCQHRRAKACLREASAEHRT